MNYNEDRSQIACVRWFRLQYPNIMLHHSPNGGKRTAFEAMQFKHMGTVAGFADLFMIKANKAYHGLYVELKAGKGRQTAAQKEFEKYVRQEGYQYAVCRSLDEFMNVVNNYLKT